MRVGDHLGGIACTGTAVLVPVKGFRQAKTRLRAALTADERAVLARTMADCVLRASAALPTIVMTADVVVARWARRRGCGIMADRSCTLSGSVNAAVTALGGRGLSRVVVLHADLPLATDVTWLADADGVTLVPDRRDDGTNAASVPTGVGFQFSYGPGSRARHEREAYRLGMPLSVVRDPSLGWDVDHPQDLRWPTAAMSPNLSTDGRMRQEAL